MTPLFKVSNTNKVILDELGAIFVEEGIGFWRGRPNAKMRNPKHKPQGMISISGMKRMRRFLAVMYPFVIAKRPQMDLLLEYIDHRMARDYHSAMDEYETQLLAKIRDLNRRGTEPERSEANTLGTGLVAL